MMNRWLSVILSFSFTLLLFACGCENKSEEEKNAMSEMEQLKYDNTSKKLEAIYAEANEVLNGNSQAEMHVYDEIRKLEYDFDEQNMGQNALEKCRSLKKKISALKENPEMVFKDGNAINANATEGTIGLQGTLVTRKNLKIKEAMRFPYSLNANDRLSVSLTCSGNIRASLYDINRQKLLKQWTVSSSMSDNVHIAEAGIFMFELTPLSNKATVDLKLSYEGIDKTYRKHVYEDIVDCKSNEFLAMESREVHVKSVFKEPKKVTLRGNLKSMFSGKSRALVSVPVPSNCQALLYSLHISTNERTVSSDNKFENQLSLASKRIKILGVNVYEKHSVSSSLIERLLFNTKPPREEDAYCNLYVLTNAVQAKKFQDEKESSGKYKYDVNQSQMSTQSCNGQLLPNGKKMIYLGLENARVRYDNYITLEVAALTLQKKFVRPVYMAR